MKIFNTTEKDVNLTLNIQNSKNLKITTNKSLSFKFKPKEPEKIWLNVEALKKGESFYKFFYLNKPMGITRKRELDCDPNSHFTF